MADEPDARDDSVRFKLQVLCLSDKKDVCRDSGIKIDSSESHLLLVRAYQAKVRYGDEVTMLGTVKVPEVIVGDDGREFDYPAYLSKDSIFFLFDGRQIDAVNHDHGNPVIKLLYLFKQRFVEQLNLMLPSPHSFLAGGLVVTGKGSLSKELQMQFQKVGLIHIVVLSGFNVTIVGEAVMKMLASVPKIIGTAFGALSIILFSLMTGGGSTVIRSMIMSLIGLYARLTDRKNTALASLTMAALVMLMVNPTLLLLDPSFQMSFAATLGLILLSEPYEILLRRWIGTIRIPGELVSLVSSTMATQTFTMPLILRFSGIVSIIALPVNIIVLPVIPLTMLFVFLTASISFMSALLATPFAYVSWLLLAYELAVVNVSSSFSFAALFLKPITWNEALAMYMLVIIFIWWVRSIILGAEKEKP